MRVTNEKNRKDAADFVLDLNVEGRGWEVTVEPLTQKRSLDQNALYHRWVGIIAAETGNSHNGVHEWCKGEFLPPQFVDIEGTVHQYRPSTAKLKTAEMAVYMDNVQAWAGSFLGIALPLPPLKTEQR